MFCRKHNAALNVTYIIIKFLYLYRQPDHELEVKIPLINIGHKSIDS